MTPGFAASMITDGPHGTVVTFGTAHSHLQSKPFGDGFVAKLGARHVHVAQAPGTDYQGLSLEDFADTVLPLCRGPTITYGSSLGGYAAVFYAGLLGARAIAASPLAPYHPMFGSGKPWAHGEIFDSVRSPHPPTLLYDPHVRNDQRFVDERIAPAYPDARHILVPHCGHGGVLIALKDVGLLSRTMRALFSRHGAEIPASLEALDTAITRLQKAKWLLGQGRPAEALELALSAREMARSPRAESIVASCLRMNGREAEARQSFAAAVAIYPALSAHEAAIFSRPVRAPRPRI